jgi:hypothetical protein
MKEAERKYMARESRLLLNMIAQRCRCTGTVAICESAGFVMGLDILDGSRKIRTKPTARRQSWITLLR